MSRRDSDDSIFDRIKNRLDYARSQHPEGTEYIDVHSEFGEFLKAALYEGKERTNDELLDLIVTCFRVIKGGDRRLA